MSESSDYIRAKEYEELRLQNDLLKDHVDALKSQLAEVTSEHADDWKRIQDAERALEAERAKAERYKAALNFIVNDSRSYSLDAGPYCERARQALAEDTPTEPKYHSKSEMRRMEAQAIPTKSIACDKEAKEEIDKIIASHDGI